MKRWLFDQIHKRNLIYNQCWEDPAVDHQALQIRADDRIVTIRSIDPAARSSSTFGNLPAGSFVLKSN